MTQRTAFLAFILGLAYNCTSLVMDSAPQKKVALLVVPGLNGLGGQNITTVLPQFDPLFKIEQEKESLSGTGYFVETPRLIPDFGQGRCLGYLGKKMSELPKNTQKIIHASSQGTATAINYTAQHPENIKALILESVMLTGNSAVSHTVKNDFPIAPYLPCSYYWLPYLAKFIYPWYAPAGEQPIFNTDKLPKNMPIIILHNTQDPQLNFKDAEALYAHLKQGCKNENAYLIAHNNGDASHVLLLKTDENQQEISAIQHVLQKNDLLPNAEVSSVDLTTYQPAVKPEWTTHFNNLKTKETRLWYFDKFLKTSLCAYLVYLLQNGLLETILEKISF